MNVHYDMHAHVHTHTIKYIFNFKKSFCSKNRQIRELAQLVECLPGMHKALGVASAPHKLGMAVYTCNPRTLARDAGKSETYGHLWVHSVLRANIVQHEALPTQTNTSTSPSCGPC